MAFNEALLLPGQENLSAAALLIGNELLSGKTRDANLTELAQQLGDHGIDLVEARIVRDDHDCIANAVNALRDQVNFLFVTGGIGPTHDDITAEAIAGAVNRELVIHDEADRRLREWIEGRNLPYTEERRRMARTPMGAELIDNSVSVAPGFSIENIHVFAGVPSIMKAMLASLIPNLPTGRMRFRRRLLYAMPESELAQALDHVVATHPDVAFGSYPKMGGPVELIVTAWDAISVDRAHDALIAAIGEPIGDEAG